MSIGTATASVLVSDVVDSTALRTALGEERADAVRRDLDAALAAAVEPHGGSVVKGLGDGLLVLFGGAAEAIAAGIAMQQSAGAAATAAGVELAMRVGISAGDVSVEDGDCFGTPVVEAARLCAAAGAGDVLVADVVRVLARGRGGYPFEPVGELELKGLAEPVATWRVPWEPAPVAGTGLRQAAPYVGREAERHVIGELLGLARSGSGATALVVGEPGIGKSRLVHEVCSTAAGCQVLWGGCHDGDVVSGAAFAEAIAAWARGATGPDLEAAVGPDGPVLAGLAPALREVVPGLPQAPAVPADEATARLQDAVCQWLRRLASRSPVVLVIDDLHWADDTTVRLLRAAARVARDAPVLVVGTYRETDLDRGHPLADALPLLRREAEPTRLALSGLDAPEIAELLRRLAGHDVPAAFAELLAQQCDGNPFFIRETLLHLWEEGRIEQRDGVWSATTADLGIPEGVREVLGRRLRRLSPIANKLLGIGALFEVEFALDVVADVAQVDEDEALDAVDEALAAQIIRATDGFDAYAFTHALFRHTLVAELNPSRQVRMHRAIADALEKRLRGAPTPAEAAVLARHYLRSAAMPGAERGVPYALRAAEDAEATAAFREAYELHLAARELVEPGDERELAIQEGLARTAVLAQVPVDDQLDEANRLGDLVALAHGDDAAADAVARLTQVSGMLDEATTTWRLAAVARRWLRPDRRDDTWIRLRTLELNEREANDPDFGLMRDTPERREVFAAMWSEPRPMVLAPMTGMPGRAEVRRWLAVGQAPPTEAFMRFAAAEEIPRLVEVTGQLADDARAGGRLSEAVAWTSLHVRALLLAGEHERADAALAEGMRLVPRISERSNATFQILACYAFAGWARGNPMLLDRAGLGEERAVDPNTRWAGVALLTGSAYTRAWVLHDESALDVVGQVLPSIAPCPPWAPNHPLILHFCVGVHWWLERTDHLDVLERLVQEKVIEPDHRYPEADGRWIVAQIAALQGDPERARRSFAAARAEIEAAGAVGLLPHLVFDVALAEARTGDIARRDAALDELHALTAHELLHPWRDVAARLRAGERA